MCFHLDVQSVGDASQHLQVELLLSRPLRLDVQSVDEPLPGAAVAHPRAELRALKVQIAQTI